jgi:hypothetical protein
MMDSQLISNFREAVDASKDAKALISEKEAKLAKISNAVKDILEALGLIVFSTL